MDLLLSVTGGLGRLEEMEDGTYAYVTTDDCLGAGPLLARPRFMLATPLVRYNLRSGAILVHQSNVARFITNPDCGEIPQHAKHCGSRL